MQDDLPTLRREVDARSARRFFEVSGRRAALLGSELGVFECWFWPLKVCHDFEITLRCDGERVRGRDCARSVEVRPETTSIEYACEFARVRQTMFAPLDLRALVVLFEVDCRRDLVLELHWTPDFRPQWPAGLGGQIALADSDSGCFALSEELGRFAALFGSPQAEPVRVDADHALPREPVTLRIPISAARAKQGPIPFFITGGEVDARPLSARARVGEEGAALGHARTHAVLAQARELYQRAASEWPRWRDELRAHWRGFLARTTSFESDDARHTEAFSWAKIAIEKAWVEVDGLGRGLVAGLGPSGSGERPGFGWFFDGDALVASRAMSAYGDFDGARRVFDFAASHQRTDGKMMHELVLSARLCNWLEDYPYAYYKAGNTPGFIACLAQSLSWSNDVELRERAWPHVLAAYRRCLGDLDDDGCLSNRRAGIAAVEAGPLVGRIRAEIYLQGIWMSALRGLRDLATARGEHDVAADARARLEQAEQLFERFWSDAHGRYGFAHLTDGSRCDDLTAFQAHPLSRGFGRDERARATAACLNRPSLASDWGVRLFAADAGGYDAANYNTGSVFPYANNFAVLAQYRHGLASSGWQLLAAQLGLQGFSGLGFVPEHLVGDRAEAPLRGVPHQIFSSAAIVQSTVLGLLGVAASAADRALVVAPALPPRSERAALRNLRIGDSVIDLALTRTRSGCRTQLAATFTLVSGAPLKVIWRPIVPPLSRAAVLDFGDGRALETPLREHGGSLQAHNVGFELRGSTRARLELECGPELVLDDSPVAPGATSSKLRVCEVRHDPRGVAWTVWGLAGRTYRIGARSDVRVAWSGVRTTAEGELEVEFAGDAALGFVARELRADLME